MTERIIEVVELEVRYGMTPAVGPLSFAVDQGQVVALVGPSGSGKSSVALALMALLPPGASTAGSAFLGDVDVLGMTPREARHVRGRRIAMVAQDAGGWLDPVRRLGYQVEEAITAHRRVSRMERQSRALALLSSVGLPGDDACASAYPHELSGGMRQRAAIAVALAGEPELLIADEPTSALDAAMQLEIVALLRQQATAGMGVLLITHDRGVVSALADRSVDVAATEPAPNLRDISPPPPRPYAPIVLRGSGLRKRFGDVTAVDKIDIGVRASETVALVGASGSGKSTLARLLSGLTKPDVGWAQFHDHRIDKLKRRRARDVRRRLQFVSQDAYAWLDPRQTIGDAVAEPLHVHGLWEKASPGRVTSALDLVHLDPALAARRPFQLSGGQRARAALARALVLEPEVVVLDEPLASVDWDLRYSLLKLLTELQARLGLAYVLVSHDLRAVAAIAHRTAVVHEGRIVEEGPTAQLFRSPHHPHTKALVEATAFDISAGG